MKAAANNSTPASTYKNLVAKDSPLTKFCALLEKISLPNSQPTVGDFAQYASLRTELQTSLAPSSTTQIKDPVSLSIEGFKAITLSLVNGLHNKMDIKKSQKNFTSEQSGMAQPFVKTISDDINEFKDLSDNKAVDPNQALKNLKKENPDPNLVDAFKNATKAIFNLLKSLMKFLFGLVMGEDEAEQKKQEEDAEKMWGALLKFLGLSPEKQQENKDQTSQNLINEYRAQEDIKKGMNENGEQEKPKKISVDDILKDLTGNINETQSDLEKTKAQLNSKDQRSREDKLGVDLEVSKVQNDKADKKAEEFVQDDKSKSWVDRVKPSATENQKGSRELTF